jgi:hypothetical protein
MRMFAMTALTAVALSAGAAAGELVGPPDDANLTIYRDYAQPTGFAATVKIDGRKVAALTNRRYTALRVTPGPHVVTLSWPFIAGQSGAKINVKVAAGQRHYLAVTGISHFAGMSFGTMHFNTGSGIVEVDAEIAERAVKACCVFKGVR